MRRSSTSSVLTRWPPRGRVEWTAFASSAHLALASLLRGDLARALRRANQALAIAERRGWARSEPAAVASCVLAAICIQRDQLRRGRTPHRPGERGGARHTRAAAPGRPRPQSRAAVERPRRARRRTRPPPRRRASSSETGRCRRRSRAADRRGRAPGRGDGRARGRPRAARACDRGARWPSPTRWPGWICWTARRRRRARRSPRTWTTWTRATGRPCRYAPRPGCSTRWPSTLWPSTRPPRTRWNEHSTSPSRQGCAGCS